MLYRFQKLCVAIALAGAGLCFAAKPLVKIRDGKLMGTYSEGTKVYAFKGIRYALPPTGPFRWKPPVPEEPWKGIQEATEFGPRCMQGAIYKDMIFRDPGPNEDCLTVNVWTTSLSEKTNLPVMFWIHGGGFAAGGSSEPRQDGENLARRGVVVVSLNYRLNVFGFYTHPDLTKESTHHASGNYGLLDMVAALEWVHNNILSFGGDPTKVTIFGESAGSMAVSGLMASSQSKDLFARAIGESGAMFSKKGLSPLEQSEAESLKFEKEIKAASLGALRGMSAEDLMQAALNAKNGKFPTVVDGYFLADDVPAIFAAGKQAHVPLLAGWNKNEGQSPAESKATVESFTADAEKKFGEHAADFLKLYPAGTAEEAKESAADLLGDERIAFGTWRWIEAQLATGESPVYRYFFTHSLPAPADVRGAYHSADIEFVFDDLGNKDLKWREEDKQLSNLMATYWTNFAKTGDPNREGIPNWPSFKASTGYQVMRLDTPASALSEAHRLRYEFLAAQ